MRDLIKRFFAEWKAHASTSFVYELEETELVRFFQYILDNDTVITEDLQTDLTYYHAYTMLLSGLSNAKAVPEVLIEPILQKFYELEHQRYRVVHSPTLSARIQINRRRFMDGLLKNTPNIPDWIKREVFLTCG